MGTRSCSSVGTAMAKLRDLSRCAEPAPCPCVLQSSLCVQTAPRASTGRPRCVTRVGPVHARRVWSSVRSTTVPRSCVARAWQLRRRALGATCACARSAPFRAARSVAMVSSSVGAGGCVRAVYRGVPTVVGRCVGNIDPCRSWPSSGRAAHVCGRDVSWRGAMTTVLG